MLRRSARVASAVEGACATGAFAALEHALLLLIFTLLPAPTHNVHSLTV